MMKVVENKGEGKRESKRLYVRVLRKGGRCMHMHDLAYSPRIFSTRNDTLGINSKLGKKETKRERKTVQSLY